MNASVDVIVREVYPSLNEPPEWVFWMTCFMLISFIVGICGHASTVTTMLGFGRTKKRNFYEPSSRKSCLIIWILCILDLLAILSIPTAIIESLVGFWIFGSVVCKVHLLFYVSGQTSVLVVAIWCVTVEEGSSCTKLPTKYRALLKLATVILIPLQSALMLALTFNAQAVSVPIFFIQRPNTSDLQIRIFKCTTATYADINVLWTVVEFTTFFAAPLMLICLVTVPRIFQPGYVNLRRQGTLSDATSNVREGIANLRAAAQLAAIYAFCWLPFWISGIYQGRVLEWSPANAQYSTDKDGYETMVNSVARALPYAFVACNWVFYSRVMNDGKHRRQLSTDVDSYNPT